MRLMNAPQSKLLEAPRTARTLAPLSLCAARSMVISGAEASCALRDRSSSVGSPSNEATMRVEPLALASAIRLAAIRSASSLPRRFACKRDSPR